ncbi:archaemetzincin [Gemmata sp.]|uniref:archaemetzincin n=1 Tax=Gemmata sp. TaxID=1914242 RepID=UPI003F71508F
MDEQDYPEIEDRLGPLGEPLERPRPGDWLAEHREKGQTFPQYLAGNPVRRDAKLNTIYLCEIGECDAAQRVVLDLTREFLALYFDAPVIVRRTGPTVAIPNAAKRKHPEWGDRQLLAPYVLHDVLEPDRPGDALAYLAFTPRDLWAGDGWNFVYGQADLRRRVAVLSIYRNGHPAKSDEAFRLCLRRTLMTAVHETAHVLTLLHCTANRCLMNGCNNADERDTRPLNPCPVCLRKLVWNLQVEPVGYLRRLAAFCEAHGFNDAAWFGRAGDLHEV